MLVQFHKNDTGKFPPATTYDNLKRISDNTGKMLRKSGKASRENSNITPFVSSSSSTTSDLIPWLIVAKENVRGTFNMRKAEKNFFRGLVREYLFLRFKNINKYMISDPSGKKDYGIPRDRVGDFLGWYGEKAAEKQNKDQREMLQTLHRGEKLRNLEKRI